MQTPKPPEEWKVTYHEKLHRSYAHWHAVLIVMPFRIGRHLKKSPVRCLMKSTGRCFHHLDGVPNIKTITVRSKIVNP